MGSGEKSFVLNPLDYVPPRNYVRLVFPIPLKAGVEGKFVFSELQEALHKTFAQENWLAGKVFRQSNDAPGWRPGQLEIRYRPYSLDGPRPYQLKYNELDTDWTYDEFKDAGFPAMFPEEALLDAPRVGNVDVGGADIFLAQVNYLPGGILLGMTTAHSALDAAGMLNATKLWAENFRELHGRDVGGQLAKSRFSAADNDRGLPESIWQREYRGREPRNPDDEWLRGLVGLDSGYPGEDVTGASQKAEAANPTQLVAPRDPQVMINKILFLSSGDMASLQQECVKEPLPAGMPSLSVSDCINALFWRGVRRSRSLAAEARGTPLDPISVFESPVDVRQDFALDFPGDYLGNCFLFNTARLPLAQLVDPETSLGAIAQTLRRGAARINRDAIHDAYALLRATPDLSRVQGRFVERPESADLLLSNIIMFPMTDLDFGDRYFDNGGVPQALRVVHAEYAPYVRLGHVLPKSSIHGGAELSVNLFDDEWEHLEADTEFNRYLVMIES